MIFSPVHDTIADYLSRLPGEPSPTAIDTEPIDFSLLSITTHASWTEQIKYYLSTGNTPTDLPTGKLKTFHLNALPFTIISGTLYRMGPDHVLRRVLETTEIPDVLKSYHSDEAGGHLSGELTARKIYLSGYWWPTVHKDCENYVKRCDACQRQARPVSRSIRHRAQALYPVSPADQGQVERTNGILVNVLKKTVALNLTDWDRKLNRALWVYRTTYKVTTGYTPFQLVYGQEAILPVEFLVSTLRVLTSYHPPGASDLAEGGISPVDPITERVHALHQLTEKRIQALYTQYVIQARRKQQFDQKVKHRDIRKNDLVLKYNNRISRFPAKFATKWLGPYWVQEVFDNGTIQLSTLQEEFLPARTNVEKIRLYNPHYIPETVSVTRIPADKEQSVFHISTVIELHGDPITTEVPRRKKLKQNVESSSSRSHFSANSQSILVVPREQTGRAEDCEGAVAYFVVDMVDPKSMRKRRRGGAVMVNPVVYFARPSLFDLRNLTEDTKTTVRNSGLWHFLSRKHDLPTFEENILEEWLATIEAPTDDTIRLTHPTKTGPCVVIDTSVIRRVFLLSGEDTAEPERLYA
ncbi:hypothetical protein R1sor_000277 [Riccia sorocarpa]|uniref:Integrase zinc-binding domain-containing protein n=1 Tax=Riccia sorocarpa TaxID=122646 RepID=A0ABD3GVV5_9MARC